MYLSHLLSSQVVADKMPPTWIILALSVALSARVTGQNAATTITIEPSPRRKPNEEVTIRCQVAERWRSNTVLWWRKTGQIKTKIGSGSIIDSSFDNGNRYQAAAYGQDDGFGYSLTISNLQHEDSAEIGCQVRASGTPQPINYVKLAVCDDIENQACKCIALTGFNSPKCYEKDPSIKAWEQRYTTATAGLGVCLAIAIIFGLVMSVLVGWDCMARMAAKRKRKQELAQMRKAHNPSMYAGSEEVELDPHETNSQVDLAPSKPRNEKAHPAYNQITTKAVAHTNRAYEDEDTGYQEIEDDQGPPQYNNYKSHSHPAQSRGAGAGALPSPRPLDTYDAGRYANEVRSPGGPRTPHDALAVHAQADMGRSPGAWSTHSANPAPGAFQYPAEADPQHGYSNGDVSPRYAQPSPRNAYSERPPPRPTTGPTKRDQHLQPRALFNQQYPADGSRASPRRGYEDDYEDQYPSGHPTGAYMDKAGLSV